MRRVRVLLWGEKGKKKPENGLPRGGREKNPGRKGIIYFIRLFQKIEWKKRGVEAPHFPMEGGKEGQGKQLFNFFPRVAGGEGRL